MNDTKLLFLLGIFVALLIGMNLLGGKVIPFFGLSSSVAILMAPLTFLITDIVAEVYGRKTATRFVLIGVVGILLTLAFAALFIILPPHERYPFNEEYRTIFGTSLRFMIASVTAFFLSQLHDVWAFEFWKKKTKGKWLWLRNNLSTIVSQGVDTFVFMTIAFYGVAPQYTMGFILELALPYYAFKVLFAVLDTPFVYLGVRWLRQRGISTSQD
jgi:hypothetical protein